MNQTLRRKPRINDFHLPPYSVIPTSEEILFSEPTSPPPMYSVLEPVNATLQTHRMIFVSPPDVPMNEDRHSVSLSPTSEVNLDDFTFEVQLSTVHEDATLRREAEAFRPQEPSTPATSTSSHVITLPPLSTINILPSFGELEHRLEASAPPLQMLVPPVFPSLPRRRPLEVVPPRHTSEVASGYLQERNQGLIHPLSDRLPSYRPNRIIDIVQKEKNPGYTFVCPTASFRTFRHIVSLVSAHIQHIRYAHDYEGVAHVVTCLPRTIEQGIHLDPRVQTCLLQHGDQVIFNYYNFGFTYEMTQICHRTDTDAYVELIAFDNRGRWFSETGQAMTPMVLVIPLSMIHPEFHYSAPVLNNNNSHLSTSKLPERFVKTWIEKLRNPGVRKVKTATRKTIIDPLVLPPTIMPPQKYLREPSFLPVVTTNNAGLLSLSSSSKTVARPERSKTQ